MCKRTLAGLYADFLSSFTAAIPNTNMGASVPKEDLIAFGVLNEDGSAKADNFYKTFETGTST